MFRTLAILGMAFASIGGAVAGTVVPINLTTSPVYLGTCNTAGCTPALSATTTGTFENNLFSNVVPTNPVTPGTSPQTAGPTSFTFAAQSAAPNDDIYVSPLGLNENTAIQVDLGSCTGISTSSTCGLYNVDDVYTMIQASGAFGWQGVTVTLSGVGADGVTPITDVIQLTAGVDYRGINSTQAITCTDANSVTSASCSGEQSDSAQLAGTDPNPGGTGGNSVQTYNNAFGGQTSQGHNYYLDVQELELGSNFLGGYLDSIEITNASPSGGKTQLIFSGLTADTVDATPEPASVAMLAIGIGLLGFLGMRVRRA